MASPRDEGWHGLASASRRRRTARSLGRAVYGAVGIFAIAAFLVPSSAFAATPPTPPLNLVATAGQAAGQVSLTWSAPSSMGGANVTDYGYAKSTDGGATFSAIAWFRSTATQQSSGSVPGLTCTTRANQRGCRYRVFARNSAGASVASNTVTTWVVPSVPANFRGSIDSTYSTASLKWDGPTTTGAFSPLTYRVLRSVDGGGYSQAATTTALSTSVGCSGARTCNYEVFAGNGQGNGPTSAAVGFTVAPSAVVGLAVTNTGSDRATGVSTLRTTWSRPASGLAVARYELQQCGIPAGSTGACGASDWGPVVNLSATATTRTSTCTAGLVTCSFKVRAVNTRGAAGPFSVVTLRPGAPIEVTTTPSGPGKAEVRFRGPTDSGTGTPKSYSVFVCAASCATPSSWSAAALTVAYPRTDAEVTCSGTCEVRMQFNAGSAKSILTPSVRGIGGPLAGVAVSSPSDGGSTNADPVVFTGACTAAIGGNVTVAIHGTAFAAVGPCTSAGTWSATMPTGLGDGSYSLHAEQHGPGGSATTPTRTLTVDRVKPVVSTVAPGEGAHTSAEPVPVSGTCTAGDGNVTVAVTGPTSATASVTCSTAGTWAHSFGSLTGGAYALDVRQTDDAGNTGTPPSQRTFHVDRTGAGTVASEIVADGLQYPAMFTFDSRGRIFFSELKTGAIRILDPVTRSTSLFAQVGGLCTDADQGLFGLALDPSYPSEPTLYAYATRLESGSCQNQLLRLTGTDPLAPATGTPTIEVLFSQPYLGEHIGGHLAFGPDGLLYLSTGEGGTGDGGPSAAHSQDPTTGHGKILRFTPDGSVPTANPFAGSVVYALGFRNVFGFTFDPATGALWATENGPACNDEIDRVVAGANYGWGATATCATPPAAPANTNRDGVSPIQPAFWYSPSNGPTGITTCTGCGLGPEMEGKLLFGQWKDGEIHALTLDATRTLVTSDALVYRHPSAETPLSVERAPNGAIYFSDQHAIYRLLLVPST